MGTADALGPEREQPFAFLSGPSFSIEIMKDFPTSVVVASRQLFHATLCQRVLSNLAMRVYTSQDVVGVQLGGADHETLAPLPLRSCRCCQHCSALELTAALGL